MSFDFSEGDEPNPEMAGGDNRREELADVKTCETSKGPTGDACAPSSPSERSKGFDFSKVWTRPATYELCVVECGGKCCSMDLVVHMTIEEATVLAKLAGGQINMNYDKNRKKAPYGMSIKGGCQFLKDGACSIHEQRPSACRNFPHRPTEGCAVWSV